MDAETFVRRYWDLARSTQKLMELGLSREEAEHMRLHNRATPKPKRKRPPLDDPLLDLVTNYDLSTLQFCGISFTMGDRVPGNLSAGCLSFLAWINVAAQKSESAGYFVGYDESDHVVMDRKTGEVRVEQFGTKGHVLAFCAENGAKFLDAALRAEEHKSKEDLSRTNPMPEGEELQENHRVAAECARLAGGDKYLNHWKLVVCAW